jgi:hypothetical protein
MRKFFILQISSSAVLLTLVGLAMGIGFVQAESRSPVLGVDDCEAPCWWGIQPGETRISDANRVMIAQGYRQENTGPRIIYTPPKDAPGCIVSLQHRNGIVRQTRLSICPDLRLGDVLVALGSPDHLATSFMTLYFDEYAVQMQLHLLDCGERLSPFSEVQFMVLSEPTGDAQETVSLRWQGFALPWRYLRSKPGLVVLAC